MKILLLVGIGTLRLTLESQQHGMGSQVAECFYCKGCNSVSSDFASLVSQGLSPQEQNSFSLKQVSFLKVFSFTESQQEVTIWFRLSPIRCVSISNISLSNPDLRISVECSRCQFEAFHMIDQHEISKPILLRSRSCSNRQVTKTNHCFIYSIYSSVSSYDNQHINVNFPTKCLSHNYYIHENILFNT